MCAECASAHENIDIGRRAPSTAKSYKKKRPGVTRRRGGEEGGKREMTTIETFDFVAREVTPMGDTNRVLRQFLKYGK